MTLEQLRIFVAVAEREHVTQAARDLNLTQSATSAAVAALEARYATKLFHRIGRRIELTQAGKLFLVEARAVLAQAAAAESVLSDLAELKRGSLSIAASQTVANYWLPPIMHRYRTAYPGISLALTIGNTETVSAMVHESRAELGFVEAEIDDPILSIEPVAEDELLLVVSPSLVEGKSLTPSKTDLRQMPWVFREHGSGTRSILEAALSRTGIKVRDLNVVLELPSNEAVSTAVEDGTGASALSRMAVSAALEAGTLVALDFPLPKREFLILRQKERHHTQAEQAFYRLMEEASAKNGMKASTTP
jgi:DNA-binding transcriptional LysR family regulator